MPRILTIFVVHVCYFSPYFSLFAPLHVYPVASGLLPPCRNWLLLSAKVIKLIYFFYYSFLPVKSKLNEY